MSCHLVTKIEDIDQTDWSQFVDNHPEGTVFHRPEMCEVFRITRQHKPIVIAVHDDDKAVIGILCGVLISNGSSLLRSLSARVILYVPPLLKNRDDGILQELLNCLEALVHERVVFVEVRNWRQNDREKRVFLHKGYAFSDRLNFQLNLEKGADELWCQLKGKRRNNIRRARKKKLEVFSLADDQLIEGYEVLKEVYNLAGLPLADWSLFQGAREILDNRSKLCCFGAFSNGRLVGVLLGLMDGGHFLSWYSGSRREAYNCYPNDLLYWYAIKFACDHGCRVFDFGGAGRPLVKYGVRDFKKDFGGELIHTSRLVCVHKPFFFWLGKIGMFVLKYLKFKFN